MIRSRPSRFVYAVIVLLMSPVMAPGQEVDAARLLRDLQVLAHDSLEGRGTGTPGAERARKYLESRLTGMNLTPERLPFAYGKRTERTGVNLIVRFRGVDTTASGLVVTAHYDHEGIRNGQIYNGSDDNASGTAALLAIAEYLSGHPPRRPVAILFTDAEERGLHGAAAYAGTLDPTRILLVINLDMISRSRSASLNVAGTAYHPWLKELLRQVDPKGFQLQFGHDTPGAGDWTYASDQGPFHRRGIPFLYFGVEDHEDYHTPQDDAEAVDRAFYVDVVRYLVKLVDRTSKLSLRTFH